ncbi:MAG TPA: hypothetical protein VFS42_08200, partial [Burkholderiaceae bacterium]|nr:hypothetical protein [Burkholderiaceae bacterium]
NAALAVVPLGTFNYIARRYQLPQDDDVEAIADMLMHGVSARVAAGNVNGKLFLNNCSFGLYTHLVDARERDTRAWGRGRVVALFSALATALRPHARRRVSIESIKDRWSGKASLVFIGINPEQFDDAGMNDLARVVAAGRLGVVALRDLDAWRLVKLAFSASTGTVAQLREIVAFDAAQTCVRLRERRVRAVLDGETVWLETPLDIRLAPAALRLVLPAHAADAYAARSSAMVNACAISDGPTGLTK